ncbi:DUF2798 domain-containing protein [Paraglaciecola hydrolytica]|uniref:DUF2798 domain-containing protein n=1 Tax=Paraglaciecola hydrolytica TaxID=1799789 RepID=A0A136A142_9ALTE|nr:DUF2798 domain-containing protein [Paraglaciecola hydrolytica]KXI28951.1 hypothetical protein AX660_12270 [Paraglaciecola hydrolytica]
MQLKLKKALVLLPIMLCLIGTITGIMSYVNLAPEQDFLQAWLYAFVFAFAVMLPSGALVFAAAHKLVNSLFTSLPTLYKKLLQGVLMAVAMESIMAIVTTLINHEFVGISPFLNMVFTSFIYALPIGLGFACLMTFVLQPKLARFFAGSPA